LYNWSLIFNTNPKSGEFFLLITGQLHLVFHHNLCQIWIFYHQMCILFFFMWKLSLVLNTLVTSMFTDNYSVKYLRAVVVVIVWYLDLQLPMQSVPTTTKIVSLNPAHGKVYLIPLYVINLSVISGRSVVFSGYLGFLHP
jgi:hypothetical protein